jgi:hypothetical protein
VSGEGARPVLLLYEPESRPEVARQQNDHLVAVFWKANHVTLRHFSGALRRSFRSDSNKWRTRGRELGSNESIILFSFVQLSVPCHPFPSSKPGWCSQGQLELEHVGGGREVESHPARLQRRTSSVFSQRENSGGADATLSEAPGLVFRRPHMC